MDLKANQIHWRSRYNARPPDLREKVSIWSSMSLSGIYLFRRCKRTLCYEIYHLTLSLPQFTDQFHKNQEVYVTGARGFSDPFKVDEGEWRLQASMDVIAWAFWLTRWQYLAMADTS